MRAVSTLVTAAMLAALPAVARAQASCSTNPCTVADNTSATVNDVVSLSLNTNATNLGSPTAADFTAGYKDAAGPTATVVANRPWKVMVAAAAANFGYAGALGPVTKPASDLLWGTSAGTYPNNAGTAAQLVSGNGTAGTSQQIFYRTNWAIGTDVPGTYSLAVNFTLSAP